MDRLDVTLAGPVGEVTDLAAGDKATVSEDGRRPDLLRMEDENTLGGTVWSQDQGRN